MRCGNFWESFGEDEVEERRHKVDLEGIGEAGEEIKSNEIGDNESGEERDNRVAPEWARSEAIELVGGGSRGF